MAAGGRGGGKWCWVLEWSGRGEGRRKTKDDSGGGGDLGILFGKVWD